MVRGTGLKIGLIADIHANLPALEAVLQDMPPVDLLICAGDVVGYYADPNEVCALLRQRAAWVIRGNHDAYVIGAIEPKPQNRQAYRTDWTAEHLEPTHLHWLRTLPLEMCFAWGRTALRVRHANPWDEEQYLYPDSPRLNTLELANDEILLLGHTHYPLQRLCGQGLVINPGSVGQPRDRNPLASYAVLDTTSQTAEFRRVPYDVAGLQERLRKLHWDTTTIATLSRTAAVN